MTEKMKAMKRRKFTPEYLKNLLFSRRKSGCYDTCDHRHDMPDKPVPAGVKNHWEKVTLVWSEVNGGYYIVSFLCPYHQQHGVFSGESIATRKEVLQS